MKSTLLIDVDRKDYTLHVLTHTLPAIAVFMSLFATILFHFIGLDTQFLFKMTMLLLIWFMCADISWNIFASKRGWQSRNGMYRIQLTKHT